MTWQLQIAQSEPNTCRLEHGWYFGVFALGFRQVVAKLSAVAVDFSAASERRGLASFG